VDDQSRSGQLDDEDEEFPIAGETNSSPSIDAPSDNNNLSENSSSLAGKLSTAKSSSDGSHSTDNDDDDDDDDVVDGILTGPINKDAGDSVRYGSPNSLTLEDSVLLAELGNFVKPYIETDEGRNVFQRHLTPDQGISLKLVTEDMFAKKLARSADSSTISSETSSTQSSQSWSNTDCGKLMNAFYSKIRRGLIHPTSTNTRKFRDIFRNANEVCARLIAITHEQMVGTLGVEKSSLIPGIVYLVVYPDVQEMTLNVWDPSCWQVFMALEDGTTPLQTFEPSKDITSVNHLRQYKAKGWEQCPKQVLQALQKSEFPRRFGNLLAGPKFFKEAKVNPPIGEGLLHTGDIQMIKGGKYFRPTAEHRDVCALYSTIGPLRETKDDESDDSMSGAKSTTDSTTTNGGKTDHSTNGTKSSAADYFDPSCHDDNEVQYQLTIVLALLVEETLPKLSKAEDKDKEYVIQMLANAIIQSQTNVCNSISKNEGLSMYRAKKSCCD